MTIEEIIKEKKKELNKMYVKLIVSIFGLVVYIAAYAACWKYYGWRMCGVLFLVEWSHNISKHTAK